jgi:LuxR family maltose regulon positive regulatory protein
LVSAPAGFGKTTLITDFMAYHQAQTYCWLSLDEDDNQPIRFFTYVIAALQTAVPNFGSAAANLLAAPQTPPLETIITLLCNELGEMDGRFSLILDDYHAITEPAIHQAITLWLDHLPPNLHLMLTTRSDPPWPLSRLRVRGQLTELRAADLRFTTEEAAAFLQEALGITLAREVVAALEQRTEGWIAGLQLAALSMKGRDDLSEFIAAFTGSHAFVLDYLVDEVLQQQPEDVLRFLRETAVLDHLNAALCTAVTGRADSDNLLRHFYQANLFLEALDDHREWFRFHALFRDVLLMQLQAEQSAHIPTLHRRASHWFAQAGQITPALHHALAANDSQQAADLVEQHAWAALERGQMQAVRGWLDKLPATVIQERPWLALIQASIVLATGQIAAAVQAVADLQARFDLPGDAIFAGELAHLQATLARFQGDSAAAIGYAQVALSHLPDKRKSSRAAALMNLAMSYIARGDTAAASQALTAATAVDPQSQLSQGAWQGLAWLTVRQGRLPAAEQIYQQTISQMDQIDGRPLPTSGAAYVGLAEVLLARYELTAAQTALQTGVQRLRGSIEQILLAVGYGRLAYIHQALSEPTQAQEVLVEADTWLAQMRLMDLGFSRIVAGYRAWIALRQGNRGVAAQWVSDSGLMDMPMNSISEMLYPILVRVLVANGRLAPAQTILDTLHKLMTTRQWHGQLVEIYGLQAMLHQAQNRREEAIATLKQALTLAEKQGHLFFFVDEGQWVADLLPEIGEPLASTAFMGQLRRLLAQLPDDVAFAVLPEALSEREMEVLHLVAEGATNRDIADHLFIAIPTVKKHMSNILVKLDTTNRTQAISRAREIGLIQ